MKRRNRKIFFDQPIPVTGISVTANSVTEGDQPTVEPTVLETPAFLIPFMSGRDSGWRTCNSSGVATSGVIEGFGQSSASDTYPVISSTGTFSLTADTCYSFIMPCTAVLDKINLTVTYAAAWSSQVTPFVAIATADPGTINFTIQYDSQTFITPATSNPPTRAVYSGRKENINLIIEAGTKVAILTSATSNNLAVTYSMAMNGSLLFKPPL